MPGLARIRRRLPLIVFLLLLVLLVMVVGFACACLSDHPMQQADRAASPLVSMPALVEVWSPLAVLVLFSALVVVVTRATGRASPALTQRFLF